MCIMQNKSTVRPADACQIGRIINLKKLTTMYDNYNYPAGADTPDAPWNQTDLADVYGDEAETIIDEEIDCHDNEFIEWALDREYLPEEYTDTDVDRIAKNKEIRSEYRKHRFDDVVNMLAEKAADDYDYDYERYMDMYDD